jgi:hypothetical protein
MISSAVPGRLARGHRELLSVRSEDGSLLTQRMLQADADLAVVDLGWSPTVGQLMPGLAAVLAILAATFYVAKIARRARSRSVYLKV